MDEVRPTPEQIKHWMAEAYGRVQAEERLRRAEKIIAWAGRLIEEARSEGDIRSSGEAVR
jgi:hypothetical protein